MNTEMNRELQCSTAEMLVIITRNVPLLTDEQKIIYDRIMLVGFEGQGGFFFFECAG